MRAGTGATTGRHALLAWCRIGLGSIIVGVNVICLSRSVVVVSLVLLSAAAWAQDDMQSRYVAAKRYLEAVPIDRLLGDAFTAVAKQLPEDKRADFIADAKAAIDADSLGKICLTAMVKHFTTEELTAMADFYGSKIGASIISKFGPYMADIMPPLQAEVRRSLQELLKKP